MARWSGWTVVVAVFLLLMPVGGCSGKKKGADLGAEGGQGLGEESLGGGGSLAHGEGGVAFECFRQDAQLGLAPDKEGVGVEEAT